MMSRIACIVLASLMSALASAQVPMVSRKSIVNYSYLYGGGPFVYSGQDHRQRESPSDSDALATTFSEAGADSWAGLAWSASVFGDIHSNYSIEGGWGAATGIRASGSTQIVATAGGDIPTAQILATNPGNSQEFEFEVITPQDVLLSGIIDRGGVPLQWLPGEVAVEYFNGFTWAPLFTSNSLPGGNGFYSWAASLGPGHYRIRAFLSAGMTIGNTIGALSYLLNYDFQLDLAPVGRTVEGVVQLQQWFGPVAGEQIHYMLYPVAGGSGVSGGVILDAVGRFSIQVYPDMKPGLYTLSMQGRKWQRKLTTVIVPASGTGHAGALLLRAGDCDGNNVVDSDDYDLLVQSFGESPGNPDYDERADLDGVNGVDTDDFDILVQHFGEQGDAWR